jgi:MATE family multidrug resistance protein
VPIRGIRGEFRPLLRLAWPLVLGEIGWVTMSLVDTMMVGRVSKEAMGGVSLGSILFFAISILGYGVLLGLDTLVSQSFGARRIGDCNRSLIASLWLCLLLSPLLMAGAWAWMPLLSTFGVHPDVIPETIPYLKAVAWGTLPLLLHTALRRYLQAMDLVMPIMFSLLSANLINAVVNWILIFGHWGFPRMGAEGAGWATCVSRTYMALVLVIYLLRRELRQPTGLLHRSLRLDLERVREIVRLGGPAAAQLLLEVGVWASATTLLGKLEPLYLAAHHIALMGCSYTFMVPFGLSAAAAVRVGQAVGKQDPEGAKRAGWASIVLAVAFMSTGAAAFLLFPTWIARAFTNDPAVISASVSMLAIAAFFQLFDGTQAVATGALRGAGDTRTPAVSHLLGYWIFGLPVGYLLCFHTGLGASGMWVGLCVAIVSIGSLLGFAWHRRSSALARNSALIAAYSATT